MIKRVFKELFMEWRIVAAYLIVMFALMFAISKLRLDNFAFAECCGMDAFACASQVLPESVFPICCLLSISVNKNNFNSERVVLSKSNSSIWNYTVLKTAVLSILMAVFIFIVTFFVAELGFSEFYNWNSEKSNLYDNTGYTLDNVNYLMIFTSYFCQVFYGIYTASIMPMAIFWYVRSYIISAVGTVIILFTAIFAGTDFIYGQNIYYDKMIYGMDMRYHFIYPVIVLIIIILVGSLKKKRDYI